MGLKIQCNLTICYVYCNFSKCISLKCKPCLLPSTQFNVLYLTFNIKLHECICIRAIVVVPMVLSQYFTLLGRCFYFTQNNLQGVFAQGHMGWARSLGWDSNLPPCVPQSDADLQQTN